ncbi:hypothetical protein PAQ31011_03665 [Pandoraea aquatica]|uniref:Uncharacterized protein n=1 Tax=Pandoraea aquatica TaxID=2508290 RepID=A0A5E4X3Y3_9BURK|nr:hypothetical protein [Pandoraea aquatica]VVE30989.1 hypothetical protein PAQ31011_03665 [Pandoraea aquatica]
MSISLSTTHIGLAGAHSRSLNDDIIDTCTQPGLKFALRSLWESIKDWYYGTNKSVAMNAVHTLATAETTRDRFEAFATLLRCVEPQHRHRLQWHIDNGHGPRFQIGDYLFLAPRDWTSQLPMLLQADDMAHLILSFRHENAPVLETLDDQRKAFREEAIRDKKTVEPDDYYRAHTQYLKATPSLLSALTLIGMNAYRGDLLFAYDLRYQVERAWMPRMTEPGMTDMTDDDIEDGAAKAGSMAQDLLDLVPRALEEIR